MYRMYMEKVPIEQIFPNRLNPRKDYSVQTEEMQKIIKEKGWETGITCYAKSANEYIILSGHRRWYAATQLKEKYVPVFIVEAPKTELEELERLGSSQSGKVDWTPYEWARYSFDLWMLRDKCTYRELALKMGVSENLVASRIKVFRYFPHNEIEAPLEKGKLTISVLVEIMEWVERLAKKHPDIVSNLSMDMIRGTMVKKAEKKRFKSLELRVDKFLDLGEKEHILKFLRDLKMTLKDAHALIGEERSMAGSKLQQVVESIEMRKDEISHIDVENPEDAERILRMLDDLHKQVNMKKYELEHFLNK